MDWEILAIIGAVLALVVALAVVPVVSGRRRREPPARPGAGAAEGHGAGTAVLERAPAVQEPPAVEAPPPPVEAIPPRRRFRERLGRSRAALARAVAGLVSRGAGDEAAWEELEEALIAADVGVRTTAELLERLRDRAGAARVSAGPALRDLLREELLAAVGRDADRGLALDATDGKPAIALVVGVNGTGKTTTVGKLALALKEEGKQVVLAAADTFRAAAAEQLALWGERVGAPVIRQQPGSDPAAVAFDALAAARARGADVLLVDTAGRLHTKVNLMEELKKIRRVLEREGGRVSEVLLVLDATTGQNGLAQARQFTGALSVTGLVLTKLDGTAKGGIVVAVQRELGIPVKLVGLGEGERDLAPFDPEAFVDALVGEGG